MYIQPSEIVGHTPAESKTFRGFWPRHKKDFFVLAAYVFLSIIMTFPVVFKLNSEIPIWQSDTYQVIGQIQNQINTFQSSGFLGGMLLLAKGHQINIFFLYAVPGLLIGKILAYNIIFLLSFILSAFGAYFLAFYFTRSRPAAFLAGLIYAFVPFHFYHSLSTHVGTMHQEWLPFFVLFLFKFFENFKVRYFILTAFFFLVIAMTEHQLLAFTAIFIGIFVVFKIFSEPGLLKNKKFLIYSAASVLLLVLVSVALFGPLIQIATSQKNYLNAGIGQAKRYAISPADPIIPAASNSLWPNLHKTMLDALQQKTRLDLGKVGEKMSSSFLGYTGIILMLAAFLLFLPIRKSIPASYLGKSRRLIVFWTIIFIAFYVFSLGPAIIFDGRNVNMPYNFIYKHLPFYENIRTTGRFFVYAILGASILASFGFAFFARKATLRKFILAGVLGLAILLEFATAPIPTSSLSYSPFYDRIAKESGNFKLLEIPGSTDYDFASFQMMTNSVHQKPVVNGMTIVRKIDRQFEFQENTPVIRQLLYDLPNSKDKLKTSFSGIIKSNSFDAATDILNYYNIKYITIQKKFISETKQANIRDFVKKYITTADTYEDNDLVAYQVKRDDPQAFYATIINREEKWSDTMRSAKDKVNYRRASSGAQIQLENMSNSAKKISVSFSAKAEEPKKISFEDKNGGKLASLEISGGWQAYAFDFPIAPGANLLVIRQFDDSGNEIMSRGKAQAVSVSNVVFFEKK